MKFTNLILGFSLSVGTIFSSSATIHTVDNNPDAPGGVFSTVQAAASAASAGDSIFIVGSGAIYASVTVDKELHFFGAGYDPNKQSPFPTTLSSIVLNNSAISSAKGTSITGIEFSSSLSILFNNTIGSPLEDITIERTTGEIGFSTGAFNNIILKNNILNIRWWTNSNTQRLLTNVLISNNIIGGVTLATASGSSILCQNNLFIGSSDISLSYTIFANNIYYGIQQSTTENNRTYNNNITFGSSNNNLIITGTNSGANNIINQDPLFVSSPNTQFYFTSDYNLQPTSPGINAGTDGTDIGIYGGPYPWPEGGASGTGFMYSQEADIPQTNQMNVQNSVVPLNGTLNVDVRGITNH